MRFILLELIYPDLDGEEFEKLWKALDRIVQRKMYDLTPIFNTKEVLVSR